MLKGIGLLAIGLAMVFGNGPAKADYVVYTNRASFEAALSSGATERFEEAAIAPVQSFPNGLSQANGLIQPITVTGSGNFLLTENAATLGGFYP